MTYLLLVCQGVLAVTLLQASVGKMLYHEQFLAALRLSDIPNLLTKPLVALTPVVEMCLALGLILSTPYLFFFVMSLTLALLCIFTLWMLTIYYRGLRLKCGCFGAGGSVIGPRTIFRNVLLVAVSLVGLILSLHVHSLLPAPSFWLVVIVLSIGMSITLLWIFHQALPALNLSPAKVERTRTRSATHNQS